MPVSLWNNRRITWATTVHKDLCWCVCPAHRGFCGGVAHMLLTCRAECVCSESRRQQRAARVCVCVWWTYGNAAGQGIKAGGGVGGTVLLCERACVCVSVCWDEFITKLKDLMRHAEGQWQKEVPALAQWFSASTSEGGAGLKSLLFWYNKSPPPTPPSPPASPPHFPS